MPHTNTVKALKSLDSFMKQTSILVIASHSEKLIQKNNDSNFVSWLTKKITKIAS